MTYSSLIRLLERFPVVGGLPECEAQDHREAIKELFSTLIVALSPLWLGAFVLLVSQEQETTSLWRNYLDMFVNVIRNGELIIFCTTLLSPFFYIALTNRPALREFPSKLSNTICVFIIFGLAMVIFSFQRADLCFDSSTVFKISIALFVFSVCILYVAMVYNHSRFPDAPGKIRKEERKFSERYEKHRE